MISKGTKACRTCGVAYLCLCLNKHPHTHTFENSMVRYDQNESVCKQGGRNVYGITEKHQTCSQFITEFTAKSGLQKYIKHHTTFIWQYIQKTQQEIVLNKNNLYIHWDYINNPIVQYHTRLNNQWGTKKKFAYLIGIEREEPEEVIIKTSVSNYIKDPKHDFAAAHHVIRKYCIQKQSDWRDNQRQLKQLYFRSDRGEFLCVGFMFLISELSMELKVDIFWDFGAPNHNKDECDAEGHVSKTGMDDGVESKQCIFSLDEEPVITAANFCNEYLNGDNKRRKRKYNAILDDDVSHASCSNVCILFGLIFCCVVAV